MAPEPLEFNTPLHCPKQDGFVLVYEITGLALIETVNNLAELTQPELVPVTV